MKVPQSIGDIYDEHKGRYDRLASAVESRIRGQLDREWHFVGRVKSRESFTLKAETGRVPDLAKMEDFYACTVVVRNAAEIGSLEVIIRTLFEASARRPPQPNFSHDDPSNFNFDHLRIYFIWVDEDFLPPTEFAGMCFEVQIKTYLQHAWSIATHDLVYKTDEVNWRKARIAYQIKAMLDHAEVSIAHAEQLAAIPELQIANDRMDGLRAIINVIKQAWDSDLTRLPTDVRRLAENVSQLLHEAKVEPAQLETDLAAETMAGRGVLVETLSPFGVVLQTLLNCRTNAMRELLSRPIKGRRNKRIVIPAEIEIPDGIDPALCPTALFIRRQ